MNMITANQILAVLIPILTYLLLRHIFKGVLLYLNRKNNIEVCKLQYNEETIIDHLDFLINETLEAYIILEVTPKQISYINSKLETEMTDHIKNEISDQLSPTLYEQLSIVYSRDYIPKLIASRIYMAVLNYTLSFNDPRTKNNNEEELLP